MTYRCGIGRGMRALTGLEEGPPHIRCDGCGLKLEARTRSGAPPTWLLEGKAPRGWMSIVQGSESGLPITRRDYCPACRDKSPK